MFRKKLSSTSDSRERSLGRKGMLSTVSLSHVSPGSVLIPTGVWIHPSWPNIGGGETISPRVENGIANDEKWCGRKSSSRNRNLWKCTLLKGKTSPVLENWPVSFLGVIPEQSVFYIECLPQNETQIVPRINGEFPGFGGHKLGPSWYFNTFWKQGSCE